MGLSADGHGKSNRNAFCKSYSIHSEELRKDGSEDTDPTGVQQLL